MTSIDRAWIEETAEVSPDAFRKLEAVLAKAWERYSLTPAQLWVDARAWATAQRLLLPIPRVMRDRILAGQRRKAAARRRRSAR